MNRKIGKFEVTQLVLAIMFAVYVLLVLLRNTLVFQFNIFTWSSHLAIIFVLLACMLLLQKFGLRSFYSTLVAALTLGLVAFSVGLGISIS
jgi:hypothetical protein